MTERRRRGKAAAPSEFGWALQTVAGNHGVMTLTALKDVLDDHGYPVSQQSLSGYRSGSQKVPVGFVSQVIDTLDLDEDEQDGLAKAWAASLPEGERRVVERLWRPQPTKRNLEIADRIEAEEKKLGEEVNHRPQDKDV